MSIQIHMQGEYVSIYILIWHICGDLAGLCQRKVAKTFANLTMNKSVFFYFVFFYMHLLAFVWFEVLLTACGIS